MRKIETLEKFERAAFDAVRWRAAHSIVLTKKKRNFLTKSFCQLSCVRMR